MRGAQVAEALPLVVPRRGGVSRGGDQSHRQRSDSSPRSSIHRGGRRLLRPRGNQDQGEGGAPEIRGPRTADRGPRVAVARKPVIFIPGFPASELQDDVTGRTVFPPSLTTLLDSQKKRAFLNEIVVVPGTLIAGPPITTILGIAS